MHRPDAIADRRSSRDAPFRCRVATRDGRRRTELGL